MCLHLFILLVFSSLSLSLSLSLYLSISLWLYLLPSLLYLPFLIFISFLLNKAIQHIDTIIFLSLFICPLQGEASPSTLPLRDFTSIRFRCWAASDSFRLKIKSLFA